MILSFICAGKKKVSHVLFFSLHHNNLLLLPDSDQWEGLSVTKVKAGGEVSTAGAKET
jgi:hypothetical protein